MATRQIVIDIADIKTIRWTCPNKKCGATVEIPIPPGEYPHGCFFCKQPATREQWEPMEKFVEYLALCVATRVPYSFVVPDIPPKT